MVKDFFVYVCITLSSGLDSEIYTLLISFIIRSGKG